MHLVAGRHYFAIRRRIWAAIGLAALFCLRSVAAWAQAPPAASVPPTAAAPNALPTGISARPLPPAAPPVAFMPAVAGPAAQPALATAAALPPLYPVPVDPPLAVRHAAPVATGLPVGAGGVAVANFAAAVATPTVHPVSTSLHKDTLSSGLTTHQASCRGCSTCQVVPGGGPCDPITQVARPPQICGRCCTPDSWETDDCYCGTMRTNALHDLFGCGQFVVSSGVAIPAAGGVLGDRLLTGWGVDVAMRSPILPPMPNRRWFAELGVSFMQNGGKGSPITADGTQVSLIGLPSVSINDAFSVRIRDVRRTAFTTGLGMTILPAWLNQNNGRLVSIVPRFGMRWGGAHISDNSQLLVAQPPGTVILPSIQRTDTFFGVYGSLGVQSTWCHVPMFCLCVRELSLGAHLNYVNDWLDLGDITGGAHRTISTVSPMLTLAIGF